MPAYTSEDRKTWDKVTTRMYYRVEAMSVGSVPEDLFDLGIKDGLVITDSIRGIEYAVASDSGDPFAGPMNDARNGRRGVTLFRVIFTLVNVIIAVGIIYLITRSRKEKGMKRAASFFIGACLCSYSWAQSSDEQLVQQPSIAGESTVSVEPDGVGRSEKSLGAMFQESERPFNWVPKWRERGDCGPCALYVLMSLEGHQTTLAQVKGSLSIDADTGCSLDALSQAAESLGFPAEARFVRPSQITQIPLPFIIHGKESDDSVTGHFIVVVGYDADKDQFAVIDPVIARYSENPVDSRITGYSGYVLVPRSPTWIRVARWSLPCLVAVASILAVRGKIKSRRAH